MAGVSLSVATDVVVGSLVVNGVAREITTYRRRFVICDRPVVTVVGMVVYELMAIMGFQQQADDMASDILG